MKINLKSTNAAYWMLTTTALFLACNHVIGRSVEGLIPPIGLSFWRWMVGTLILLPLVLPRFRQSWPQYRKHFPPLLALAFMMVGSTTLVLIGLNHTTAINTSVLSTLQPVMTVVFAAIFIHEKLTGLKILGVLLGFFGLILMISKADWQLLANLSINKGDLLVLLSVCGFSGYSILLRRLPKALNGSERLFAIALLGALMLLPFYLWEHVSIAQVPVNSHSISVIITLALLISVLGNAMWNGGIMIIGPSRASSFINLIPIFGAVLAVLFLGEQLHGYHLIGGLMVGIGIKCVINNKATTDSAVSNPQRAPN